jgi:hypothetical protein
MSQSINDTTHVVAVGAVGGTEVSATDAMVGVRSFDYGKLPAETADTLKEAVNVIRASRRAAFIGMANHLVEVGNHLVDAKKLLEHGGFTQWLKAELDMGPRTAENYMNAARWLADKPEIVLSHLPAVLIYQLAAKTAPTTVVEEVVQAAKAGALPLTRVIRAKLRDAKNRDYFEKWKAEESSKQTARQRKSREAADTRHAQQQRDLKQKQLLDEQRDEQRLLPLANRVIAKIGSADHEELRAALNNGRDNPTIQRLLCRGNIVPVHDISPAIA